MKTVNSFDGLQELMYSGQLENKQFPMESVVDYTILSPGQTKLFKHVLVGLEMYTPQELYAMNSSKKAKIFKRHKQAQTMLNLCKQELTNDFTNRFRVKTIYFVGLAKEREREYISSRTKMYVRYLTMNPIPGYRLQNAGNSIKLDKI